MNLKKMLVLLGVMIVVSVVLVACGTATTTSSTEAPTTEAPAAPPVEVPNLEAWKGSAHNALDTEPFLHWSNEDNKF